MSATFRLVLVALHSRVHAESSWLPESRLADDNRGADGLPRARHPSAERGAVERQLKDGCGSAALGNAVRRASDRTGRERHDQFRRGGCGDARVARPFIAPTVSELRADASDAVQPRREDIHARRPHEELALNRTFWAAGSSRGVSSTRGGLFHRKQAAMVERKVSASERVLKLAQAQGRVSVQANCSIADALTLMEDRASLTQHTLDEIAAAICRHDIWF